jgi:hypothetical protein
MTVGGEAGRREPPGGAGSNHSTEGGARGERSDQGEQQHDESWTAEPTGPRDIRLRKETV